MFVSRILLYVPWARYFEASYANVIHRYHVLTRDPPQFAFIEIVGNQPCDVSSHAVANEV
jgi:hypothetical protein